MFPFIIITASAAAISKEGIQGLSIYFPVYQ